MRLTLLLLFALALCAALGAAALMLADLPWARAAPLPAHQQEAMESNRRHAEALEALVRREEAGEITREQRLRLAEEAQRENVREREEIARRYGR